jgi:hypothetical protein
MRKSTSTPRRARLPEICGRTIGTWRVLYLTEAEKNRQCMCQCVRCGVKKFIEAFKFRKGYALRCPECKIREELAIVGAESRSGFLAR